jgi:aconitate hydratase
MGVLPLEFTGGATRQSLGLTGFETFDIEGLDSSLAPRRQLTVEATGPDGATKSFQVLCRIDTPEELNYYTNGGILPYVLRSLARR